MSLCTHFLSINLKAFKGTKSVNFQLLCNIFYAKRVEYAKAFLPIPVWTNGTESTKNMNRKNNSTFPYN